MESNKELLQKKKDTLGKIIDEKKKDDISLYIGKNAMIDYLLDEEENELNINKILKGLLLNTFCSKSLKELAEVSKQIKECNTISEVNNLETSIENGENAPVTIPQSTTTVSENSDYSEKLDHFNIKVAAKYREFYNKLKGKEKPDFLAFSCAKYGYDKLLEKGELSNTKYLTVVDFTKPRSKNRFYVINMDTMDVEIATRVGHGHNSGEGERATSFSNRNGSEQSSLGFLTTSVKRESNHNPNYHREGLRMYGTENSNNNAASRGIFMHRGQKNGSLFSQGCFVIPNDISETVLKKVAGGSLLFAYAKNKDYFQKSNYFEKLPNGDINIS